jgi:osmotically-inducible protein OsmY
MKISNDEQLAQELQQGFKNDQSLSSVASGIQVTVKGGAITLDGQVSTEKQVNLASSTAMAIGMVDHVDNRLKATHRKA